MLNSVRPFLIAVVTIIQAMDFCSFNFVYIDRQVAAVAILATLLKNSRFGLFGYQTFELAGINIELLQVDTWFEFHLDQC